MCPINGKKCREHKCDWYIQIMGSNPNTGQELNQWGCAVTFIPVLLIENSQQQRQTGKAIESFRNEMVRIEGKQVLDRHLSGPDNRAIKIQ